MMKFRPGRVAGGEAHEAPEAGTDTAEASAVREVASGRLDRAVLSRVERTCRALRRSGGVERRAARAVHDRLRAARG